jgi:uncharacterized membrane protein
MVHEDEERPGGHTKHSRDAYDLGRLLAFSDGVFAIAITLLVLAIPVPTLPKQELGMALRDLLPNFAGFVLSFVLVGLYWSLHHQLFRALLRCPQRLLSLNLVLLLCVCLVPFSAALLPRYGDTVIAVQVYAGNMALVGLLFGALRLYLSTTRGLADEALLGGRLGLIPTLVGPVIFLASIPMASWNASAAEFFWLTMIPIGRVSRLIAKRFGRVSRLIAKRFGRAS